MEAKKIKVVLLIFFFLLTCASCLSNNNNVKNDLNPFEDINDNNTTIMSEYGHSPYNFPKDYVYYYQNNVLDIPYTFYGGSVNSEVCLLVFIDGIAQPYTIGNLEEAVYDYVKIFNIDTNSEETYMLNLIPTHGKLNDVLKLNFVCIDFPSLDKLNESTIDFQSMSTTISWKLSYLEDAFGSALLPYKEPKIKIISNITEKDFDENYEFNNVLEKLDTTTNGTNKTFKFISYGGENGGHYRTTIFLNNVPLIIDSDNNFIEYKINKDEKLIYEFEIDDKNLGDKNVLYAISINLNNSMDTEQAQIDVNKTPSILFDTIISSY